MKLREIWVLGPALLMLALLLGCVFVVSHTHMNGLFTGRYLYVLCVVPAGLMWGMGTLRNTSFPMSWVDVLLGVLGLLVLGQVVFGQQGWTTRHSLFVGVMGAYLLCRIIVQVTGPHRRMLLLLFLGVVLAQALYGLCQYYGLSRALHSLFPITGSFHNPGPLGGLLATALPVALACAGDAKKGVAGSVGKGISWGVIAVLLLVLPLTLSRAAWVGALAGCGVFLWGRWGIQRGAPWAVRSGKGATGEESATKGWTRKRWGRGRRWAGTVVGALALLGLLVIFYYLKKDSADGRLFIWKRALGMVAAHPLSGVGLGRFPVEYAHHIASYFQSGVVTASEIKNASSPDYAFNELVQVTCELGLGALVVVLSIIGILGRSLKRGVSASHPDAALQAGTAGGLTAWGVFALFSYPLSVLPLCVTGAFLCALMATWEAEQRPLRVLTHKWGYIPLGLIILGCLVVLGREYPKDRAYREWKKDNELYTLKAYRVANKGFAEYAALLRDDPQFMLQYARSLSLEGRYAASNDLCGKAQNIVYSPILYYTLGNNYRALGDLKRAEEAYWQGYYMNPSLFYPLHLLAKLYHESGQHQQALRVARMILEKPVKINSPAIEQIKRYAQGIIK